MSAPILDADEKEAMDKLLGVMNTITRDWGLLPEERASNLRVELAGAVHVIQGFIVQHMLQRLAPEQWGVWFEPSPSERSTP